MDCFEKYSKVGFLKDCSKLKTEDVEDFLDELVDCSEDAFDEERSLNLILIHLKQYFMKFLPIPVRV